MDAHLRDARFLPRLAGTLFGVFGVVGLVLAARGRATGVLAAFTPRSRGTTTHGAASRVVQPKAGDRAPARSPEDRENRSGSSPGLTSRPQAARGAPWGPCHQGSTAPRGGSAETGQTLAVPASGCQGRQIISSQPKAAGSPATGSSSGAATEPSEARSPSRGSPASGASIGAPRVGPAPPGCPLRA